MSIETARIELDSATDSQKELHGMLKDDVGNPVYSMYQSVVKKSFWSVPINSKLAQSLENDIVVYEAAHNFHFLRDLTLHQQFPIIRVRDEYKSKVQICYPHNLAHTVVISGEMYIGERKTGYVDTVSLDNSIQFRPLGDNQPELTKVNTGNIPILEEWTDILPRHTTISYHPFYYRDHVMYSIPLLFLNDSNRVKFKYRFRNKYSDIIRMRYRGTDKEDWKEIPYNSTYLVDVQSNATFALPDMYGSYRIVTDDEVKMHKSKLPVTQYIGSCYPVDSKKKYKFGDTVELDIKCTYPIQRIFISAINDKSYQLHNYSNYSTNRQSSYVGHHPISQISLIHRDHKHYDDTPIEHFERREPLISKYTFPSEPGYAMCNLGSNNPVPFTDTSLVFNDQAPAKLSISLHDTNPYLSHGESGDPTEEFVIAIRLAVIRRLTFNVDGTVTIV